MRCRQSSGWIDTTEKDMMLLGPIVVLLAWAVGFLHGLSHGDHKGRQERVR
jgi:hypothetical protein